MRKFIQKAACILKASLLKLIKFDHTVWTVSALEENLSDRDVTTLPHPTPDRTPLPPNKIKEVQSGHLPLAKFPDAEKYI